MQPEFVASHCPANFNWFSGERIEFGARQCKLLPFLYDATAAQTSNFPIFTGILVRDEAGKAEVRQRVGGNIGLVL